MKPEIKRIKSHFLDSGAFSFWNSEKRTAEFFDSPEFFKYVRRYAKFIKENQIAIDLYANVDVIGDPERSWRNQKLLEKKYGLNPVPVVHYKTDLAWLRKYIDAGYKMICLGGLVGNMKGGATKQNGCRKWIQRCFEMVCDTPDRKPCVRLHGFGISSFELMIEFPWWSVDSSTWIKVGAFGSILVPHKRGGKFVYDIAPNKVAVSVGSAFRTEDFTTKADRKDHYLKMTPGERAIVDEWLALIGMGMGRIKDGKVVKTGVATNDALRKAACVLYFEEMRKHLPKYPWPYRPAQETRKGFGFL